MIIDLYDYEVDICGEDGYTIDLDDIQPNDGSILLGQMYNEIVEELSVLELNKTKVIYEELFGRNDKVRIAEAIIESYDNNIPKEDF